MARKTMAKKAKKVAFDPNVFLATVDGGRTISTYRRGDAIFCRAIPRMPFSTSRRARSRSRSCRSRARKPSSPCLDAGEFFGEGCLIAQPLRLAAATAMTESAVMRVDKAEMIRALHDEPAFAELFTAHLLTRNSRVEEDLVDQLFNSSEKRLARMLLLLANFGKEGRPEPITKISQETLAEMIGTTRPRVSFFMNKFRKLGFIDYNGSSEVHSSLLNVVLRD